MTETVIETTKEDIKRIKDGLKQINDSGLLEEKVLYASVKHVEIKDLFLKTVEQIDEEKEDQIPVTVILLYNEFNVDADVDEETETETETETEPTVKKERRRSAKPFLDNCVYIRTMCIKSSSIGSFKRI